jgi:hypothetical protein
MALINWLLKLKMHINTYFLNFCFGMKIRYEIFYIFERLDQIRYEDKIFLFFFCNISEKTKYFNTKFVSLQYKNMNQY